MTQPTAEELLARIAQLEVSQARLRRFLGLVVLVVAAVGVIAGKPLDATRVIEAERFVVKSNGLYRGELGIGVNGRPFLVLNAGVDEDVRNMIPDSDCGVYLYDGDGQAAAVLEIGHRGDPTLRIGTTSSANVRPGQFLVYDEAGMRTWYAPTKK